MRGASAISILLHGATGRMGRAVESAARAADGVSVRGAIDTREGSNTGRGGDEAPRLIAIPERVQDGDVVIDFSRAGAVAPLVRALSGRGFPLVCGTTGLPPSERDLLEAYSKESPVFYDENMSYGISLLKRLLRLARPMLHGEADVEIVEFHHRDKADFPSGTAIALARAVDPDAEIISGRGSFAKPDPERLHVHAVRLGAVPGEHQVHVGMAEESLTFSHRVTSRDVFARGAIAAARFVVGRESGFFAMEDLLEEQSHV